MRDTEFLQQSEESVLRYVIYYCPSGSWCFEETRCPLHQGWGSFLGPLDSDDRRATRQTIQCHMSEDLISHEIISSEYHNSQ